MVGRECACQHFGRDASDLCEDDVGPQLLNFFNIQCIQRVAVGEGARNLPVDIARGGEGCLLAGDDGKPGDRRREVILMAARGQWHVVIVGEAAKVTRVKRQPHLRPTSSSSPPMKHSISVADGRTDTTRSAPRASILSP